jgi:Family of unknown function (DUF5755)
MVAKSSFGKKCIPGLICVENMTLFMVIVIGIGVAYLLYVHFKGKDKDTPTIVIQQPSSTQVVPTLPLRYGLEDAYPPPLKTVDIRGPVLPVNVATSSHNTAYQQIGILTKNGRENPTILPLMGRNLLNGRDKWQYYTVSNTPGAGINSRLPISVNGKSCTGEYGCDSVSNGDTVYVEGYNDTFRATIYENARLNYIPY